MDGLLSRRRLLISIAVLAVLAFLPALTASPGRMVADSKLYLYLDPQRFLGDNLYTFDPRQFAGWVPHQHISYLWPTGPWYWLYDTIGVSDWIAHRLWIGTLMLCAGLGTRWVARLLGLSAGAALVAAVVYQVSPYILPYVSRTSVMLLPFAGLGWIVGLAIVATRRRGWAAPAGIALIVVTVGAVNATALAMIVPGPLLWLIHAAWARRIDVRRALVIAGQTAVLCLGVSAWWIVMLLIQARHGADVVAFSEALDDVALTSTGPEVTRGLGYWLFYIRDAFGPTTSASLGYLTSSRYLLIGYALTIVCALGLVALRWADRRFAALLIGTGVLLAVGVHPTGDPSPLVTVLTGGGSSGLAEALRSSTRALPLVALGLGLGAAALVDAVPSLRVGERVGRQRLVVALALAALAVVNLPALWSGGFTDPVLDRDGSPPDSWTAATDELDTLDDGYRVLQLPGAEFGAFRWGYTVDQPLPGMTDRPLVTRDLLPLGSPGAMDLVFALDDRAQSGVLEPDSLAPVSRLLGVDTIWGANDAAFERFRTARPEVVADVIAAAPDVQHLADYGAPTPNIPDRSMLDETEIVNDQIGRDQSDVTLWSVSEPVPVIRAASDIVYVSGSGDGLIDAATAGIVDPATVVRYTAAALPGELAAAAEQGRTLVVTDSNRDRAHHWRSSQDVVGATESGGPGSDVLVEVVGDERLDVFGLGEQIDSAAQTVAIQVGPVQAAASGYGEPFAYRPENRPAMAIDGDHATAWKVADRADAVGEFIRLSYDGAVDQMLLRQPDATPDTRVITAVDVKVGELPAVRHRLDERSLSGEGQLLALPDSPSEGEIELRIAETSVPEVLTPEVHAAVGFSEIDVGLGPTVEWIRPPVDALEEEWTGQVATVLTRHRTDPLDRWRDDPEPALRRLLPAPLLGSAGDPVVELALRIDQRAPDDVLSDVLGVAVDSGRWAVASARMAGSWTTWGQSAVDGDPATSWRSPFGQATGHRLTVHHGAAGVESFVLQQPTSRRSLITAIRLTAGDSTIDVSVPPPDGEGRSSIELPETLPGARFGLQIIAVDESTTIDPRYGEITVLPSAVSELEVPASAEPVEIPETMSAECRTDLLTIDGRGIGVSFSAPTAAVLAGDPIAAEVCGGVSSSSSDVELAGTPGRQTGLDLDRVVISSGDSAPSSARPIARVTDESQLTRTVQVDGCQVGCWLVLGEGYNEAWSAEAEGTDLGPPQLVDGGFNGWRLPPGADSRVVDLRWTAQGPLNWAFVISLLTVALAGALVAWGLLRRQRLSTPVHACVTVESFPLASTHRVVVLAVTWIVASALLIDWIWGLVALGGSLLLLWNRRPAALATAGWAGMVGVGVMMVLLHRVRRPFPNGGWPGAFADLHEITLFALVTMVVGAVLCAPSGSSRSPTITRP